MSNNPFEEMINALDVILDPNSKSNKPPASTECECGGRYTKINKTNHFRTTRHIKYLETGKSFVKKRHWQLNKLADLPEEDRVKKREYLKNYYQQIAKPKMIKQKELNTV